MHLVSKFPRLERMWKTLGFFLPIQLETQRLLANDREQQVGSQRMALLQLAVCPRAKILRIALQACCRVSVATRPETEVWEAWAATTACESEDAVRARTKSDNVAAPPGDERAIPAWMRVQQEPRRKAQ